MSSTSPRYAVFRPLLLYRDAIQLESTTADESEPYKFKYSAREVYQQLVSELEQCETTDDLKLALGAALHHRLACNYIDCEEPHEADGEIQTALEKVVKVSEPTLRVITHMNCLTQKAFLKSQRGEYSLALDILNSAVSIYKKFSLSDAPRKPSSIVDLLTEVSPNKGDGERSDMKEIEGQTLEDAFTVCLFLLAQVHRRLGNSDEAARCCRDTLLRQLEFRAGPLDGSDAVEFAANATGLAEYYLSVPDFVQARHCICAALVCIDGVAKSFDDSERSEDNFDWLKVQHTRANVFACSANYSLALLECSRDRMIEEETSDSKFGDDCQNKLDETEWQNFYPYLDGILSCEKDIPHEFAKDFASARVIFLHGQSMEKEAKKFYQLNDHCSDFVNLTQVLSRLFKALTFFEPSLDRRCKMHKRRIDALDELANVLNPDHFLLLHRQLLYELGDAANDMLDLKLTLIKEGGSSPTEQQKEKVNKLCRLGIKYFTAYIDSFKDPHAETQDPFKVIDSDSVRSVLVSRFYIGRLWSKIVPKDNREHIGNRCHSLEMYEYIVHYCERIDTSALEKVKDEYRLSREISELIPLEIEKLRLQN